MKIMRGFSLIELIITIIGVLAAITISSYVNYMAKTRISAVLGELGGVNHSMSLF